jgi:hypothetical protein
MTKPLEWYDNSTLEVIDSCHRKAFWNIVFQHPNAGPDARAGLEKKVGAGAFFGTCIHAALAKYYGLYNKGLSEQSRRIAAFRAFASEHERLFPDPDLLETKHTASRGLDLLDMYFDHYLQEDQDFEPLESELYFSIRIEPLFSEEPFEPFNYVGRGDNIFRRRSSNDLIIFETKTTGYGIDREIMKREIDRQTEGYYFGFSQFDSNWTIMGVMLNVIGVSASAIEPSKLFQRAYYRMGSEVLHKFRKETILKVKRWRSILADGEKASSILETIEAFDRRTEECTNYGRCTFYDLCKYGPTGVDWKNQFPPNTWNPLGNHETLKKENHS